MKQYKFSLKDECMKELPSMTMPIAAYTSCGYVKDDLSKELLINANEYNNHIASLRSIKVPTEYLNQFSDGRVYNEDEFYLHTLNTYCFDEKYGYGCDNCCNGDRCDNPKHVSRKSCKQCGGAGWIKYNTVAIPKQKIEDTAQCPNCGHQCQTETDASMHCYISEDINADDTEMWKLEINSAYYKIGNSVAFINWLFEHYTITRK